MKNGHSEKKIKLTGQKDKQQTSKDKIKSKDNDNASDSGKDSGKKIIKTITVKELLRAQRDGQLHASGSGGKSGPTTTDSCEDSSSDDLQSSSSDDDDEEDEEAGYDEEEDEDERGNGCESNDAMKANEVSATFEAQSRIEKAARQQSQTVPNLANGITEQKSEVPVIKLPDNLSPQLLANINKIIDQSKTSSKNSFFSISTIDLLFE